MPEQAFPVRVRLDVCRGRRALFQELIELGARHGLDVVALEPLLGDRQTLPIGQRRRQRNLLPLRVEWRVLERRKLREKRIHELGQLAIAVGVGGPVIGGEHRRHGDGIDLLPFRDQVGIVLRRQGRGQIVGLQRPRIVDRNEMEAVVVECADRFVRLAADGNHRVDLASPHFFHRDTLLDIEEVRLDAEPLEHNCRRHEGAAVGKVDTDLLAVELADVGDRLRRDDIHLFIVELGHVGELLLDVLCEALFLEIVERVGSHDAEVDALQEQDVGDALHGAAPDDRKYAQLVSVVEHGCEVCTELNIGAADGAGDQRHRVGVQGLLGVRRSELEDGFEAFADFCRVELAFFSPRRKAASHHDGNECQSK